MLSLPVEAAPALQPPRATGDPVTVGGLPGLDLAERASSSSAACVREGFVVASA